MHGVLGVELGLLGLDLFRQSRIAVVAVDGAQLLAQSGQREPGVTDDGVVGGMHLIEVPLVDHALDDLLLGRVGHGVAEPTGGDAGAHGEEDVTLVQEGRGRTAAHSN